MCICPRIPRFLASMGFMPFAIDGQFFYTFCRVQGTLSYLLMAFISPSLVSWDISNGALQLYFCRPFSRLEYVLGKLGVVLPAAFHSHVDTGGDSFRNQVQHQRMVVDHGELVAGPICCSGIAAVVCPALADRPCDLRHVEAASRGGAAVILCIYFGGAGLAGAINLVMGIESGSLFDMTKVDSDHLGGSAPIRQRLRHVRHRAPGSLLPSLQRFASGC